MPETPQVDDTAASRRALVVPAVWAVLSALAVAGCYLVFVRTAWGQELDDLAFEGRHAVTSAATRRTDRLLGVVTEGSLFFLGGAVVLVGVAQWRIRVAFVAGCCMCGAVLTTELLKLRLLTRPSFRGVQGFTDNSFPSGHATIGIVLALGLVMVAPPRLRRMATVLAAFTAAAFGTAVLASGWHRPSDTIGAYGVAMCWFCAGHFVLLRGDRRRTLGRGRRHIDRPTSRPVVLVAGVAVLGFLVFALWRSVGYAGLRTVAYARLYVLACVAIDVIGVVVVFAFALRTGDRTRARVRRSGGNLVS